MDHLRVQQTSLGNSKSTRHRKTAPGTGSCYSIVLQSTRHEALKLGIPDEKLLQGSGLTIQELAEPYNIINQQQALVVYQNLVRLGTNDIGLRVGVTTGLYDRGPYGHLLLCTDSVYSAVQMGLKYQDLYYFHLDWSTEHKDGIFKHRFGVNSGLGSARQFCIERGMVLIQNALDYYTDSSVSPREVRLECSPLSYTDRFKELFRCPVFYSQDANELVYNDEPLHFPNKNYDKHLVSVVEPFCNQLLDQLQGRQTIIAEVKQAIHASPDSFPNIDQVSERLGCSSRTLRRKLKAENENFQNLLDQERKLLAVSSLLNSALPIQQIAERCGFNDSQNFSNAFKKWTGLPPAQYRKKHS